MIKHIKNNPAILIGILVAALGTIGQALDGDITWSMALPSIVSGIVTRFFVSPISKS